MSKQDKENVETLRSIYDKEDLKEHREALKAELAERDAFIEVRGKHVIKLADERDALTKKVEELKVELANSKELHRSASNYHMEYERKYKMAHEEGKAILDEVRKKGHELAAAKAEIERITSNNNFYETKLAQAQERIKELEAILKPSSNKYYFDQMHKYWDESIELKARMQALVESLEKIKTHSGLEAPGIIASDALAKHRGEG